MKTETKEADRQLIAVWDRLGDDLDAIEARLEAAIKEMKSPVWQAKVIAEIKAEREEMQRASTNA